MQSKLITMPACLLRLLIKILQQLCDAHGCCETCKLLLLCLCLPEPHDCLLRLVH